MLSRRSGIDSFGRKRLRVRWHTSSRPTVETKLNAGAAAVGLIAFAAGIVFAAQASVAAGAPRGGWAVRVLPPVGGESCSGVGIDDTGTVVGSCRGGLGPD